MRLVQTCQRLISHFLKETTFVGRDRLAAPALERKSRIVRDAIDARGEALPTGHFLPEEAPPLVTAALRDFLA